jgi:hypothetical protein
MAKQKVKTPTPPVNTVHPPERSAELSRIINDAFDRFQGQFDELETAIGMLLMGDYVGWKVLVMIHNKRTLKKYEEILGISVREFFPEVGPCAMRSLGYRLALQVSNFWKAVSGDIPIENRRMLADTNGNIEG